MGEIKTYTRKADLNPIIEKCLNTYQQKGVVAFFDQFQREILVHRVKFPLLEYTAKTVFKVMPFADQDELIRLIIAHKTIGGNVIIGILLQLQLSKDFVYAFETARAAIADADEWYVCDIIGERVFGVGLLINFDESLTYYRKFGGDESFWVRRSLGAGGHYAIKKGLSAADTEKLFLLLVDLSDTQNQQVKQGVGWAAKTTAKFHPQIIEKYQHLIQPNKVPNWFLKKIEIGLNRHAYAARKRG